MLGPWYIGIDRALTIQPRKCAPGRSWMSTCLSWIGREKNKRGSCGKYGKEKKVVLWFWESLLPFWASTGTLEFARNSGLFLLLFAFFINRVSNPIELIRYSSHSIKIINCMD